MSVIWGHKRPQLPEGRFDITRDLARRSATNPPVEKNRTLPRYDLLPDDQRIQSAPVSILRYIATGDTGAGFKKRGETVS